MPEIQLKEIGGLMLAVIALASGVTYYLQETGDYKTCSGGWIQMEDGMYDCPTRDVLPQWCHHGSDEGPDNIGYRCYIGIPIENITIETKETIETVPGNCPPVECKCPNIGQNYGVRT